MSFDNVQIDIETDVHPTESLEKVKRAIINIFPNAEFEDVDNGLLRARSTNLDELKERLAKQKIRAAARKVIYRGIRPGHLYLVISKQVAYAGKVSFSKDGPLGDIVVIIRTQDPETLLDHITFKREEDQEDE